METQVRTPQAVFMQPQRLIVPLFQRPYVWNEENQWEPLSNGLGAQILKLSISNRHQPHHSIQYSAGDPVYPAQPIDYHTSIIREVTIVARFERLDGNQRKPQQQRKLAVREENR
jgi:hypothetical protein